MTRQKALRLLALDALAGNQLLLDGLGRLQQLVTATQHLLPPSLSVDCPLPRGRRVRLVLGSWKGVRPLRGVELGMDRMNAIVRASARSKWQLAWRFPDLMSQVEDWAGPAGLAELVLAVERARKLVLRTLEKETSWL